MTKTYTSLVGIFYMLDSPDGGSYQTGQIISEVADGSYLLRCDGNERQFPLELVFMSEMVLKTDNGFNRWSFFNTREELKAWIDWLDAP